MQDEQQQQQLQQQLPRQVQGPWRQDLAPDSGSSSHPFHNHQPHSSGALFYMQDEPLNSLITSTDPRDGLEFSYP